MYDWQARSELRFWRGAEVDKVKNPKQLFLINLGKVRKSVTFGNFAGAPQAKITIFGKFWHLGLKFKGFLCERRRRERKFWNVLLESGIFMHLEEMAAQILWTFLLGWGGGAGAPSPPPSLRACIRKCTMLCFYYCILFVVRHKLRSRYLYIMYTQSFCHCCVYYLKL